MNELPIIEGYVRLSLRSCLILAAIIAFNTIYFVFTGHLSVFLLFLIIMNVFSGFIVIWNKRKGKPAVRIFEDRLEFKDGTKAVKINMSDLDVPIDVLYKNIVERIN